MHFAVGRARERLAERLVGAEQLLRLDVVQDDRCPADFQRCSHLTVESGEIAALPARRYREDLELRLNAGDLAVDRGERIFHPLPDIALDPRALAIDGVDHGETRQPDLWQHGRENQDHEPCLDAQGNTLPECLHGGE